MSNVACLAEMVTGTVWLMQFLAAAETTSAATAVMIEACMFAMQCLSCRGRLHILELRRSLGATMLISKAVFLLPNGSCLDAGI